MAYDKLVQVGTSTQRVGAANMQGLTLFDDEPEYHMSPEAEAGGDPVSQGNPAMFLVGLILLLVLFWFIRQNSTYLQGEVFGLNVMSVMVITITAMVGIATAKFVTARWPVPGLTPLIQSL